MKALHHLSPRKSASLLFAAALLPVVSSAAIVDHHFIAPGGITATDGPGTAAFASNIGRIVDGSGIDTSYAGQDPHSFTTTHTNTGSFDRARWTTAPTNANPFIIDFSFGGVRPIFDIAFWNGPGGAHDQAGVQDFDLYLTATGTFGSTPVLSDALFADNGNVTVMQLFGELGGIPASHARLVINSNHGDATQTILGEVAFAVPEASEASVIMLGLSGFLFGARRRKRA